jgi:hypothetical protein
MLARHATHSSFSCPHVGGLQASKTSAKYLASQRLGRVETQLDVPIMKNVKPHVYVTIRSISAVDFTPSNH